MLWFIIFGSIGLLIGIALGWEGDGIFGASIGGLIGVAIGTMLCMAPNGLCSIWYRWHYEDAGAVYLQSINTGSETNGSFFLGSGYVDQNPVYTYFAKNPDGSFYRDSVPSNETTIVESNDTPHMEIYNSVADNIWLNWFGGGQDKQTYKFYVPPGSVVQDYTLKP